MSTGRRVQTLAGPVHYKDSGWTPAEWTLIQSAMARCTGIEDKRPNRGRTNRKPRQTNRVGANVRIRYVCPNCNGPHPRKDCPKPAKS